MRTRMSLIGGLAALAMLGLPSPAVARRSPPPPHVTGLFACRQGPSCDYGPAWRTYPSYGNGAPAELGDCTFAAAAHWEQIVLGASPDPSQIGYEFALAGGTEAGLSQEALWNYWRTWGIGGFRLSGLWYLRAWPVDVENGVRDYGALIAELHFGAGWYFGYRRMAAGLHDVVVDGFTPEGPLIVTWGETVQITWEQWDDEVLGMWAIAVAVASPPS